MKKDYPFLRKVGKDMLNVHNVYQNYQYAMSDFPTSKTIYKIQSRDHGG
jgi:hypothetical protein